MVSFESNLQSFLNRVLPDEVEATSIEDILGPEINRYNDVPDFEFPIPVEKVDNSSVTASWPDTQPATFGSSHTSCVGVWTARQQVYRERLDREVDADRIVPPTNNSLTLRTVHGLASIRHEMRRPTSNLLVWPRPEVPEDLEANLEADTTIPISSVFAPASPSGLVPNLQLYSSSVWPQLGGFEQDAKAMDSGDADSENDTEDAEDDNAGNATNSLADSNSELEEDQSPGDSNSELEEDLSPDDSNPNLEGDHSPDDSNPEPEEDHSPDDSVVTRRPLSPPSLKYLSPAGPPALLSTSSHPPHIASVQTPHQAQLPPTSLSPTLALSTRIPAASLSMELGNDAGPSALLVRPARPPHIASVQTLPQARAPPTRLSIPLALSTRLPAASLSTVVSNDINDPDDEDSGGEETLTQVRVPPTSLLSPLVLSTRISPASLSTILGSDDDDPLPQARAPPTRFSSPLVLSTRISPASLNPVLVNDDYLDNEDSGGEEISPDLQSRPSSPASSVSEADTLPGLQVRPSSSASTIIGDQAFVGEGVKRYREHDGANIKDDKEDDVEDQDQEVHEEEDQEGELFASGNGSYKSNHDETEDDRNSFDWEHGLPIEDFLERTAQRFPLITLRYDPITLPDANLQPFPSSAPQTEGFVYEGSNPLGGGHCGWDDSRETVAHDHMCCHRCSPHLHIHRCGHEARSIRPVACSIRCARSLPLAQGPILACECGPCYTKYHQYLESMNIIAWAENVSRLGTLDDLLGEDAGQAVHDWEQGVAIHKKQFFRALVDEDLREIARQDPTGQILKDALTERLISETDAYEDEVREIETHRANTDPAIRPSPIEDAGGYAGWPRAQSTSSSSDSSEVDWHTHETADLASSVAARTGPKSIVDLLAPFLPVHIIESAIPPGWRLEIEAQDEEYQDAVAVLFLNEIKRNGPELAMLAETDPDAYQHHVQYIYFAVFREAHHAIRLRGENNISTAKQNQRIGHICWIHRASVNTYGFMDGRFLSIFFCTLQGKSYRNYPKNPKTGRQILPMWYDAPLDQLRTARMFLGSCLPDDYHSPIGLSRRPLFAWLSQLEDIARLCFQLVPGQRLLLFFSPEKDYLQMCSGPDIIIYLESEFQRSAFKWSDTLDTSVINAVEGFLMARVENTYGKNIDVHAWEETVKRLQDMSDAERDAKDYSFW